MITTTSICENCAHFFSLSNRDRKLLEGTFSQFHTPISGVSGVCLRGNKGGDTYIDRILFNKFPLKYCNYKRAGERVFPTPYLCPSCSNHLFVKNDDGYKVFYCKNCKESFKSVMIDTKCRFCDKPLFLEAGDVFRCECKKCGKGIYIPILPQVYPSIIPKGEPCPHNKKIEECRICSITRTNNTSILYYEVKTVLTKQWDEAREKRTRYENSRHKHSGGWVTGDIDDELDHLEESDYKIISKYSSSKNRILDWSDDLDDVEDWSDSINLDEY